MHKSQARSPSTFRHLDTSSMKLPFEILFKIIRECRHDHATLLVLRSLNRRMQQEAARYLSGKSLQNTVEGVAYDVLRLSFCKGPILRLHAAGTYSLQRYRDPPDRLKCLLRVLMFIAPRKVLTMATVALMEDDIPSWEQARSMLQTRGIIPWLQQLCTTPFDRIISARSLFENLFNVENLHKRWLRRTIMVSCEQQWIRDATTWDLGFMLKGIVHVKFMGQFSAILNIARPDVPQWHPHVSDEDSLTLNKMYQRRNMSATITIRHAPVVRSKYVIRAGSTDSDGLWRTLRFTSSFAI